MFNNSQWYFEEKKKQILKTYDYIVDWDTLDWDTDVAGAGNPGGNLSQLMAVGIVELLTYNWRGDKISIEATAGFPVKSTSIGKIFGIVIEQQTIQSWHMEMIVIVFKYLSIFLVHCRLWSYWNFKPLKVEIGWNTVSTGSPSKPIIEQGSKFPYLIFCIELKKILENSHL